ncbi:peptidoglycan DD-metalloendopeptidase family protein [Aliiroseovarius lamellibrachiae]|uniref:peptidoglycan DD-metalloendopeptidase family protein n=1 Tax=Aliiroseovarius lamellibrachiae TaxID=1924933 RepID=UPI001BDF8C71|nr:peptidoglycan DD-metalloendopeptidase family protein [Aliiroseovarius lamellibrachiae]MBT2131172.1 peptidoglycan DD-metalloendopeptidase family protein [Aliiroseovarius lamellibrachiae]
MQLISTTFLRGVPILATLTILGACSDGFDLDLRRFADGGLSTTQAAQNAQTAKRPSPDTRGIISYPGYQVALARRGDTVAQVAERIGVPAAELARYNGIAADSVLRKDELLALPRRVQEPATGVIQPKDTIDIQTLAGDAIERAPIAVTSTAKPTTKQSGSEPLRHRVERGETAYSVARLYGVSVRSLAEWNGLGASLTVREGQHLLIPIKLESPSRSTGISQPGEGSSTPTPPSAAQPLPDEKAVPRKPEEKPASPALEATRTAASAAKMSLPVPGKVTSLFDADKAGYILISAKPGTPVKAAASGTVRLVSKDVEGEQIVVIDHGNNTQTAYSFVDGINVAKGQKVKRGEQIAKATKNQYNAIQFLVFKGTDPVDPMPYLN